MMNRGGRREPIFRDDADRKGFLETLAECCGKTGWQVQAFWLMSNHFHLVVKTPQGNLVAILNSAFSLQNSFLCASTGRFNRRHKRFGHLFSGRRTRLSPVSGAAYL